MGKRLSLCVEREWYSLRDIQEVFRVSRKGIAAILKDAQNQGMPIRVVVLDFRSHPLMERQRPFIRVERQSLVRYFAAFCGAPEDAGKNSRWMEWLSPGDVEMIYGFSQESLRKILRDAEWKETPIRTMRLPFKNRSQVTGCPQRYQVERRSLNAYLEAHLAALS